MKKILSLAIVASAILFASCSKEKVGPATPVAQIVISHPALDADKTIIFRQTSDLATNLIVADAVIGAFTIDPKGSTIKLGAAGGTMILQNPNYTPVQIDRQVIGPVWVTAESDNASTIDVEDLSHGKVKFNMKNLTISVPTTFLVHAKITSNNFYLGGDALRFDVTGEDVVNIIAYDKKGIQLTNNGQAVALSGYSIGSTNTFQYYYNGYGGAGMY